MNVSSLPKIVAKHTARVAARRTLKKTLTGDQPSTSLSRVATTLAMSLFSELLRKY